MSVRALRPYTAKQTAYTELAKAELQSVLPGVSWDSHSWDVKPLNNGGSRTIANLYFTLPGSQTQALPACFADLAKAAVLMERRGVSNMQMRLEGLRHLWMAIQTRLGTDAEAVFTWTSLLPVDLENTEHLMLARGRRATSVYKTCGTLQGVVDRLSARMSRLSGRTT